ncbi:hypothetical protein PV08_04026 [Exophiala spinifera]|uniref:SRR1-like domain-containing protein n=1 Tax=Exophiala spinifera TaxID=91928 RepID=A0A0D1YNX5_9EURO|nr:uncharacterized protein PV08_04026 [Exophiala spinifera]KIW16836.1 hypothetical protein PV08_04026 [Exophiala spinifera]
MALHDEFRGRTRSAFQHALILTLRDILSKRHESVNDIKCYAQDPFYTDIDREVLERSGITVLNNPQGFLEVDDSTVVLSFCPDVPVRQVIAEIALPAMMIWDKIRFFENELEKSLTTDPNSPRLSKMIQSRYEEIEFPGHLEAFEPVSIYVRQEV